MLIFPSSFRRKGILFLVSFCIFFTVSSAQPIPPVECVTSTQSSGAIYQICIPTQNWNGDLVVYAQGFVSPLEPLSLPEDAAVFGPLLTQMGFAFATTSYRVNGLSAVEEGASDLVELVEIFHAEHATPNHVYLFGVSLGGCIAAKCAEEHGDVFNGVLALSGVYGNFIKEINHISDFRTVFNYFFPDVIPGETIEIPEAVQENWETVYVPAIIAAITSQPDKVAQLLSVTKLPVDKDDPAMIMESIIAALWFNVVSTNDIIDKLEGKPYDNRYRFYSGSDNDWRLNRLISRYRADKDAVNRVNALYQTSGALAVPTVTMHNTGDHIVPIKQQFLYRVKIWLAGSAGKYTGIPVVRYGHVNFTMEEITGAFGLLMAQVTGGTIASTVSDQIKGSIRASFVNPPRKHFVTDLSLTK